MRKLIYAFVILVILGLTEQWAPQLTDLLAIAVMIKLAIYVWTTLAQIPARLRTELIVATGLALGAGFLAGFSVGRLVVTGAFAALGLALWSIKRRTKDEANEVAADPGEEPTGDAALPH